MRLDTDTFKTVTSMLSTSQKVQYLSVLSRGLSHLRFEYLEAFSKFSGRLSDWLPALS